MSLCDCRGLFANDKEVARRRSVSREPQALLACESLIQRRAACLCANRLYRGGLRQEAVTKSFTKSTDISREP